MYQLSFYVPESHLEAVKNALFAHGAGKLNGYDRCCWQTLGEGQFRPLQGSRPYLGSQDTVEKVAEYKVEMICPDDAVKDAVEALLDAHPYEQPAYRLYRIFTRDDV